MNQLWYIYSMESNLALKRYTTDTLMNLQNHYAEWMKTKTIKYITYSIYACVYLIASVQFSSVHWLSRVRFFVTPWIAALQASLSITNSWSSPKLMSIESAMPSSHLILCHPLLLLPPIPPRITVFSNESTLRMRWPKYWSFSLSISPSNEHPGLISLTA